MNDAHRPPWLLLKFVLKLPRPVMQEFRVTRVHGPQEVLPGRRRSEQGAGLVQQCARCGLGLALAAGRAFRNSPTKRGQPARVLKPFLHYGETREAGGAVSVDFLDDGQQLFRNLGAHDDGLAAEAAVGIVVDHGDGVGQRFHLRAGRIVAWRLAGAVVVVILGGDDRLARIVALGGAVVRRAREIDRGGFRA